MSTTRPVALVTALPDACANPVLAAPATAQAPATWSLGCSGKVVPGAPASARAELAANAGLALSDYDYLRDGLKVSKVLNAINTSALSVSLVTSMIPLVSGTIGVSTLLNLATLVAEFRGDTPDLAAATGRQTEDLRRPDTEDLRRLTELRSTGVITDAEYSILVQRLTAH
jgi:hypothetical protein